MIDVAELVEVGEKNCHEPPRGIPFKKLRDGLCKFPRGGLYDPPERFCGEPTGAASSYCPECRRIAYTRIGR